MMIFEKFKEYHNSNYHDGDSTFDERNYSKSNGDDFDNCFIQDCYDHFEAGAASRQAEIDDLKAKKEFRDLSQDLAIKNIKDSYERQISSLAKTITKFDLEIDELQKRVDEASGILSQMKHSGAYKALDILKGNKND